MNTKELSLNIELCDSGAILSYPDDGGKYAYCEETEACVRMAKYIEQELIKKACELLKNTIDDDVLVKCGSVIKCMDVDDFVLYFRKAMEK